MSKQTTLIPCPSCQITIKHGVAHWRCSEPHPERLTWLDLALLSAVLVLPILILIGEKQKILADHQDE